MISPLLDRYQDNLVWFANTWLGRKALGIRKKGRVISVDNQSYIQDLGNGYARGVFYSKPVMARRVNNLLKWLPVAPEWNYFKQEYYLVAKMGLATTTFNPDADPESTSVDGECAHSPGAVSWSTLHDATASSSASDSVTTINAEVKATITTNDFDRMKRGFILFDTSSMGGATADSALVSLYVTDKRQGFFGDCDICSSSPASNTAIGTDDYDQLGATAFSSLGILGSITTSAYNDWTLNAGGLSNIDGSGISKFGVRINHDLDNVAPSWSNTSDRVTFNTADNGSNQPELEVTYTPISTFIPKIITI